MQVTEIQSGPSSKCLHSSAQNLKTNIFGAQRASLTFYVRLL